MLQAENVSYLVSGHRLDIEGIVLGSDHPFVFAVVEVNGLGRGVGDHSAARREIGMGQNSSNHGEIGIVGWPPIDDDIGVLIYLDLGEGKRGDCSPRIEGVSYCLEFGGVVRPVIEGVGEVGVLPRTAGGEGHAGVQVGHTAAVRSHLGPGLGVELSRCTEVVLCLVLGEGFGCLIVQLPVMERAFLQVAETL